MLQPVNIQLAHFNVEHSAQISKDSLAVAQQTGQGQETIQESVKFAQTVQASVAASEPGKVKRRGEEEQERRQGGKKRENKGKKEEKKSAQTELLEESALEIVLPNSSPMDGIQVKKAAKNFDFYA